MIKQTGSCLFTAAGVSMVASISLKVFSLLYFLILTWLGSA